MKYARYADDCSIAITANSDRFTLDTLNQMSNLIKKELGGLEFQIGSKKKNGFETLSGWVHPSPNVVREKVVTIHEVRFSPRLRLDLYWLDA